MRLVQTAVLATIITVASSVNVVAQGTFPSRGTFQTGNILLENCHKDGGYRQALCEGYISGVTDVLAFNPVSGWRSCSPKEVTKEQTRDVVKAWLEKHPRRRHYSAFGLVAEALAEAFPCKE